MTQVSIKKCKNYNPYDVQQAVREAVGLLGGIERFVKPGQKVLIKPNILSGRPPESGVCTHPEFLRAVIKLIKEKTPNIYVGDSPGGFYVISSDDIYEASGIKKVCAEESVKLVKFNNAKKIDGIPFAKIVSEADVIVNVPKMKTHSLTVLTGAVKNMFGTVIGKYKAECHFKYTRLQDFCLYLTKIYSYFRPVLNIMDGIVSMDGEGPSAGRLRDTGLVLASPDGVALDAVFAELTGIGPETIPTILYAGKRGLGVSKISDIEILGESIKNARLKDFSLPQASFIYRIPPLIFRIAGNFIRSYPFINRQACVKCRICQKNCPASAIDIENYHIDYSKCILCFCCHELCPHSALGVRKTFMGKLFDFVMKVRRIWLS